MSYLRSLKAALSAALLTSSVALSQVGDECINALTVGINGTFSNAGYTNSPEPWSPWTPAQNDRWFVFMPAATQSYSITACHIFLNVDTMLMIYEGSCGQLVYVDGNDDGCGSFNLGSRVETVLNAGTSYYFRVGTYGGTGTFDLQISQGQGSLQPVGSPGCGTASLSFQGSPTIGSFFTTNVENASGTVLIGAGLTPINQPFCNCFIGHEWLTWSTGPSWTLPIPQATTLFGFDYYVQGADITALGGCPANGLSLTSTYRVTIG